MRKPNELVRSLSIVALLSDVQSMTEQLEQSQNNPTNPNLKFTTASTVFVLSAEHLAVLEDGR
jgi:hypothetical protein